MNINKPLFIAEIGINHNGDMSIIKQLIDNACEANFDCVKFQKRDIDIVYSKEILDTPRESPWGNTTKEQKKGLELEKNEYDQIDKYCNKKGINWFASAWDLNSLKFLDQYNLKYNKIASAMIVDKVFLAEVAKRKKHTFISTGMSTKENIDDSVQIFKKFDCSYELMHCVSTYPMKVEDANLATISDLKKIYNCNVGYSGHEAGLAVSYAATMFGISSLERHITLDRSMYGSDQSASIELRGMRELTTVIEKMIQSIGTIKTGNVLKEEIPIAKKLRAHLKL
jgi:N-acetylneuraminate synthase